MASINITAAGTGPSIDLRITKKEGIPVELVSEGTPGAAVVAIRRVNELDFYNLGHKQLAEKVGLKQPMTSAIIWHLRLKDNADFFKEITLGKAIFQRYSQKAIQKIQESLPSLDLKDIWNRYRARNKKAVVPLQASSDSGQPVSTSSVSHAQ